MRVAQLVCVFCLFAFSAASECGGDEACAAGLDKHVLLQGTVKLAPKDTEAAIASEESGKEDEGDAVEAATPGQQIKARHGICLDASGRSQNGGKVHMWGCNVDEANQQWAYNAQTGQIKASHGICLDGGRQNGGKVHMWGCDVNNANQQWAYNAQTGQIKARHGLCLDASRRSQNGGKVHMWACDVNNANQQWIISQADGADTLKIQATPCNGDDCESKATCPSGYHLTGCDSYPANIGDGLEITANSCLAFGDFLGNTIRGIATCAKTTHMVKTRKVAVSGNRFQDNTVVKAECTGGSALWCYCHSSWYDCTQTAFPPSGSRVKSCSQYIKRTGTGRRRGTQFGAGAKIYALCSTEQCKADEFLMKSDGEVTCVKDCPPGFIGTPSGESNEKGATCEMCAGAASRRRSAGEKKSAGMCGPCPPGQIPVGGSDECQSIQASCKPNQCAPCFECMNKTAPTLATCVTSTAGSCYHPGTQWCPQAIMGFGECKGVSLGCYYKLLCSSAAICSTWKDVFCGGEVANISPHPALMQIARNAKRAQDPTKHALLEDQALLRDRATAVATTNNLDETMNDKCVE